MKSITRIFIFTAAAFCYSSTVMAQGFNYAEAMQKGLFFYEAQRSGILPADNEVTWRADSALNDGRDAGIDLTGGWYDAGDHVKFGLPMASSAMTLGWAVYEYGAALQAAGLRAKTLENIRWATDYFIKAHSAPNEFYYQVGDGSADHGWWGPVEVIEEVMVRPSFKVSLAAPGSTVTGATAAALAVASIIFQSSDPAYAALCLSHARDLFNFAYNTKSDAGYREATGFYDSFSGYWDELSAAATWLYLKTGESQYLLKAEEAAANWGKERRSNIWVYKWTHSWDDMHFMTAILLARITGKQIYIDAVERNLDFWLPGGGITYTPGGLAWLDQWGSLRYAANASFLAFVWSDTALGNAAKKIQYRSFGENQINYILGNNPRHSSYVVGFGVNSPRNPHHRTAHGAWYNDINFPSDSRHILFGALVGGPGNNDAYTDSRTDYQKNEVATDYNAGFFGALAKMYALHGGSLLADFPANHIEAGSNEYFVRAKIASESDNSTGILTQTSNRSAWPATVRDNLSYRYFFDISEAVAAGFGINDISIVQGAGEAGTVSRPVHWSGNIYYVEMDLAGTKIYPGGRAESERQSAFTLSAPTGAAWDPSNDWSRQGLVSSPFTFEPVDQTGRTEFIPLYAGGILLYGREPGAGDPPPPPPQNPDMHVAGITLSPTVQGPWKMVNGQVRIIDESGASVSGAQVSISWSGLVSGAGSAVTDAGGIANFVSPKFKNSGTVGLQVTGISKTGFDYDPAGNAETSDSLAVP
ncbi:MAG TPA: glycoside hydrolase family 9 protein [Gammaproteobacteria bacterium]|nr:glycoside hydrolase family 9 protein [Gammaproteobacteria bacterium]